MKVRIGTRGSRLARYQALLVARRFAERDIDADLVVVRTEGDRDRLTPLTAMGGAGVFVTALETELRAGSIDVAVHSLKDVPTRLAPGLLMAALLERGDARDALVVAGGGGLQELRCGAAIGTSSSRRTALLGSVRPDLRAVPIRGNVDTRLRRVGSDLDAVVLAASGLDRLGMGGSITERLDPHRFVPAPGQAIIGLQVRAEDRELARQAGYLDVPASRTAAEAERAFLSAFGGGCSLPVGAHAEPGRPGEVTMTGFAAGPDGSACWLCGAAPRSSAPELGESLGKAMRREVERGVSIASGV